MNCKSAVFLLLVICVYFTKSEKKANCHYGMCENISNYPKSSVKRIIEKHQELHSYFGNVIEPSSFVSLRNRFSVANYEPFCKTYDRTVLPQKMQDVEGHEREIVNVDKYQQVIKYQTCDKHGACYGGHLLKRTTKCVQNFHVIKLLTINRANEFLEYHDFRVPTTCVCQYFY